MRDRLFRFRRGATALLIGVGAVGGTVGVLATSGTAFAADSLATGSSLAATSAPSIPSTGTSNTAGNLTVTIAGGSSIAVNDVIDLVVSASSGGVEFSNTPSVSSSGVTLGKTAVYSVTSTTLTAGPPGNMVQIPLPDGFSSSASATISVDNIEYNTTGASGTLSVVAYLDSSAADNPIDSSAGVTATFPPTSGVSNATLPSTPPSAPDVEATAASSPYVGIGQTNQAAGNETVTFGASNTSGTSGWQDGQTIVFTVNNSNSTNCVAGETLSQPDTIGFAATPTATVTPVASTDVSTTPTVSVSLGQVGKCTGTSVDNEAIVTFTNTGTITSTSAGSPAFAVTLSGISYDLGAGFNGTSSTPPAAGQVYVGVTFAGTSVPTTFSGTPSPLTQSNAPSPNNTPGTSDATASTVVVTANSPAVSVPAGAIDDSISNITVGEVAPGVLPGGTDGYVCITLPSGSTFNTSVTPAVTPSSTATGAGTASSTVSFTGTSDNTVEFQITNASSTVPTSYTLSKLAVNVAAGTTAGPALITVEDGETSTCGGTPTTTLTGIAAYSVVTPSQSIYGQNADATAAAEFLHQFPGSDGVCPGHPGDTFAGQAPFRPVILATNAFYSDALAASYLAGDLHTGILLTSPGSLSQAAQAAMRTDGITNVYVVGGPDVVSDAVIAALKATQSYNCGGNTGRTSLVGTPQDLTVTQIYGQTEYGTAADIAEYPGASQVNSVDVSGAYTAGGMYNVSSPQGNESASPSTSSKLRTAIIATGQGWQDAESASVMAYANQFPVLLTEPGSLPSDTATALTDLNIQQVIVMGGPIAVSNSVVTSIENMGISVLRIAGQTFGATSTELADFEVNTTSNGDGLGWDPDGTITVARGDYYTDGLAGSVVSANAGVTVCYASSASSTTQSVCMPGPAPLLLTNDPTTVGTHLTSFLNEAGTKGIDGLGDTLESGTTSTTCPSGTGTCYAMTGANDIITSLTIFGGPLAVTPATISAMETDLNG